MPGLEKFNNTDGLKSVLHSDNKRQNEMQPVGSVHIEKLQKCSITHSLSATWEFSVRH